MYIVAVGATAIILLFQYIFHLRLRLFRTKRTYSVNIQFVQTSRENLIIKEIFGTDRFNHLVIKRENDQLIYTATLNTSKEFSSTFLQQIMSENSFINSLERCDNE